MLPCQFKSTVDINKNLILTVNIMFPVKRSSGVAPEVNLGNSLHPDEESTQGRGFKNSEEASPEVQNRGISVPTERTGVLQNILKKKKKIPFLCKNYTPAHSVHKCRCYHVLS